MKGTTIMNNSQKDQHISLEKREDAEELELEDMELLERLETLREDMEELLVTTLAEVIQRIEELHRKLDNQQ
ncbi:MAG: hypothetical protein ACXWPS_09345 [Ktedonobacteraceae bacterium]